MRLKKIFKNALYLGRASAVLWALQTIRHNLRIYYDWRRLKILLYSVAGVLEKPDIFIIRRKIHRVLYELVPILLGGGGSDKVEKLNCHETDTSHPFTVLQTVSDNSWTFLMFMQFHHISAKCHEVQFS